MNVLVTGASGAIGTALVRVLNRLGHNVVAMTRQPMVIDGASAVVIHDLAQHAVPPIPPTTDAIAHLAQSRSYRRFPGDADELFRVNVAGAQAMLMAAVRAGVGTFCLVSSGSVYEPFDRALIENVALAPSSALGASKLAAEVIARPFEAHFALSVLRLFTPYGPGQSERLVPDLIRRIRTSAAVTLPLQGRGARMAPTHIDDVCSVMAHALAQQWRGTFNVAAARALDVQDMAVAIASRLGVTARFERRDIGSPVIVPDLTKLGRIYDLTGMRSFEQGLDSLV